MHYNGLKRYWLYNGSMAVMLLLSSFILLQQGQGDRLSRSEQEDITALVNTYRSKACKCGSNAMKAVPPLVWNKTLAQAAVLHAADMEQQGKRSSHKGSDGSTPAERLKKLGYSYRAYGENVAMHSGTAAEVIKAWMNSPGHCRNIMHPEVTEIGVGKSGNYWTLIVGSSANN